MRARLAVSLLLLLSGRVPAPAGAPDPAPPPCRDDPAHARLDFWIGRWVVFEKNGAKDGDNTVEKALGGCAVLEHWRAADGSAGESFFYVRRAEKRWKQVWVTDSGAVKEKAEQLDFPGPGLRFQGEIPLPSGETILDRTTLTPLPDGRVRQVIEQSRDGGRTWSAWEGIYVRAK
jgi:hypothetical protein